MEKITIDRKFVTRWSILIGAIVVILLSWHIVDHLFVILAYGREAYFTDNLRVADSKHGILSNGIEIPPLLEFLRMFSVFLLAASVLFIGVSIVGFNTLRDVFEDDNKKTTPKKPEGI